MPRFVKMLFVTRASGPCMVRSCGKQSLFSDLSHQHGPEARVTNEPLRMRTDSIVITGMGLATSLGKSPEETWRNVLGAMC
jgi:hypothetical protein